MDPRLRRIIRHGYIVAYETRDGYFRIENGLSGMDGGAATVWTVTLGDGIDQDERHWLSKVYIVAELDQQFRRLKDARGWLVGSVYGHHGWLDADRDHLESTYESMVRERVNA